MTHTHQDPIKFFMHQESLNITTFILHLYTRQSIMKEIYTMALWTLPVMEKKFSLIWQMCRLLKFFFHKSVSVSRSFWHLMIKTFLFWRCLYTPYFNNRVKVWKHIFLLIKRYVFNIKCLHACCKWFNSCNHHCNECFVMH